MVQFKKSIYEYLKNIESGGDWRDGFFENCHTNIAMNTPLGKLNGLEEVNHFLSTLDELLQNGPARVKNVKKQNNGVQFLWVASGSISEISNGKSRLSIENEKIIGHDLDCSVEPLVLNQG